MSEHAELPPERPRRIACARCGASFGCLNDGTGRCWCGREAFSLPVPLPEGFGPWDDCLCPTCLRAVAAELSERGFGPGGATPVPSG